MKPENANAQTAAENDPFAAEASWDCYCEITQTTGVQRDACQNINTNPLTDSNGDAVNGWCYVDATTTPPTGNVDIVARCPDNERRMIRFVGEGEAQNGSTLFVTCNDEAPRAN